ncbi:MAG: sulfur carrier protein ThiS [Paracoccaceae bacterium]|nr:sulfur carrier protein ThiS [Paracoccaceae bacterium]MDE2913045.1 sulfur carrier protein ThiS [Paracoccaceae bacterium]
MKITVNGEAVETRVSTLAELLVDLGHGNARIATAVNEAFVPAKTRATQRLVPGDRVEIVSPRQGG